MRWYETHVMGTGPFVLHEHERARAHHVRLVPPHIPLEDVGLVDPAEGRRERGEEGPLRPREPEYDRVAVRRLDRLDVDIDALAIRRDARRREDDLVVAGLDVPGGHLASVVELHTPPALERIGAAVLGDRPRLGQVA